MDMMDINQRIDKLTEAEAKAALFDTVSRLGVLLFQLRDSWVSNSFGESAEDCANEVLDEALKEARK